MQKTNLENVSVFNKKTVEEKAREVMNKKERKTYFVFSGGSNLEFDDTEREYYLDYTEDEIARIKNLLSRPTTMALAQMSVFPPLRR